MTTTYETKCWGDTYRIRANFAQAADPIQVQDEDGTWLPSGMQVGDAAHRPAVAMRRVLTQVAEVGPEAEGEVGNIERAVAQMIECD
jgi:hypothetical protein